MPELTMIPATMRAAQCDAPGAALVLRDVPVPRPLSGQILVRMEGCGICHSDLHLRAGDENLPPDAYPLTLGHEGIGRVVAHGPNCSHAPAIGARVGLSWLYDTCLDCKPCLTGAETFCSHQRARGIDAPGAFAEYALAEARFACVIPDGIDPVAGAPLLCAGLTAWSALNKTRLSAGSRVLVIGAGGLGQYATLIAKARGARVFVVDRDPGKLAEAARLGAEAAFPAGPEAAAMIRSAGGADVVLNFAPSPSVWAMVEQAVNPMSDIVAVALVHDPVPLSMMWLINGGHRVFGSSVGTRSDLRDFLDFAARSPMPVDVEAVAFDAVDAALDRLAAGQVRGRLSISFSA